MVTAELKNHRQSPRKVRLVVDAVRGKRVSDAILTLNFMPKKAALPVRKLIESAAANADHNFNMKGSDLFIKEITVNGGSILKRWRARARGRASSIHKHTCHIRVVLASKDAVETAKSAAKKSAAAEKAGKTAGADKSAVAEKTSTSTKKSKSTTVKKVAKKPAKGKVNKK